MAGYRIRIVTDRPQSVVEVHPPSVNSVNMAGSHRRTLSTAAGDGTVNGEELSRGCRADPPRVAPGEGSPFQRAIESILRSPPPRGCSGMPLAATLSASAASTMPNAILTPPQPLERVMAPPAAVTMSARPQHRRSRAEYEASPQSPPSARHPALRSRGRDAVRRATRSGTPSPRWAPRGGCRGRARSGECSRMRAGGGCWSAGSRRPGRWPPRRRCTAGAPAARALCRRGGRRARPRRAYSWSRPERSDALCQSANSSFISRVSSSVGG